MASNRRRPKRRNAARQQRFNAAPPPPSPTNGVSYRAATKEACSSGKWGWPERGGARMLAKSRRREGSHVREYECPECGLWHVGHLPVETRMGRTDAASAYEARAEAYETNRLQERRRDAS